MTEATTAPSTSGTAAGWLRPALLWAVVGLVALLCGTLVALYWLAPKRPDLSPMFAAFPALLAAVGTLLLGVAHKATNQKLDVITHQTNGVLTGKIQDAVSASVPGAVAAALAARRSTDMPPPVAVAPAAVVDVAPAPGTPDGPAAVVTSDGLPAVPTQDGGL